MEVFRRSRRSTNQF